MGMTLGTLRLLAFGVLLIVMTAMAWVAPATSDASVVAPSLTVQPASGPVGSVVTVRDSSVCGPEVLFGPAGAVTGGSALGYSHVVHYVIPSFVGDPGRPVTSGDFAFAVTCATAGTASGITNVVVPFRVTAGGDTDPFVAMASTPDGGGYWLVQRDGGVRSFGNAGLFGSLPVLGIVPSAPITGIAATPDGGGYWLVGADGGVFAFGDAVDHGSLPGLGVTPVDPVVGMASTDDGGGYWLSGADGGLFAFGDAPYCRSQQVPRNVPAFVEGTLLGPDLTAGIALYPASGGYATVDDVGNGSVDQLAGETCTVDSGPTVGAQIPLPTLVVGPITGITVARTGGNIWLVGSDGGVFAAQIDPEGSSPPTLSEAPFYGSLPGLGVTPDAPIVGISATPDGRGYWLVGADGGVFSFGDAVFHGSAA